MRTKKNTLGLKSLEIFKLELLYTSKVFLVNTIK